MSALDVLLFGYRTILAGGAELSQRSSLAFSDAFQLVDDPITKVTRVDLTAMPKLTFVSTAAAPAQTLKTSRGTFFSANCEIDPGATTGTYYLLLIDAGSPPADGALATGTLLAAVAVDHVSGTRDYQTIEADAGGFAAVNGLCVVLSTTRPSKTIVGSNWLWVNGSYT